MVPRKERVTLTKIDQSTSEPLARTVYALAGTKSADVALRMRSTIAARVRQSDAHRRLLDLTIHVVAKSEDYGEGLILVDDAVTRYSTKYVFYPETGRYYLSIGKDAALCHLKQATSEILAMLVRGVSTWIELNPRSNETRTSRSAYGNCPQDTEEAKEARRLEFLRTHPGASVPTRYALP